MFISNVIKPAKNPLDNYLLHGWWTLYIDNAIDPTSKIARNSYWRHPSKLIFFKIYKRNSNKIPCFCARCQQRSILLPGLVGSDWEWGSRWRLGEIRAGEWGWRAAQQRNDVFSLGGLRSGQRSVAFCRCFLASQQRQQQWCPAQASAPKWSWWMPATICSAA